MHEKVYKGNATSLPDIHSRPRFRYLILCRKFNFRTKYDSIVIHLKINFKIECFSISMEVIDFMEIG